jgi:heparan sulfate 6-O-sulfotransferase HS6ST1
VDQYVFEETFNLRFAVPFEQHNATLSSITMNVIQKEQLERVRQLNALDLELYSFARKLMYQRFVRLKSRDKEFTERFSHLGELPGRQADSFNWDQVIDNDDNVTDN